MYKSAGHLIVTTAVLPVILKPVHTSKDSSNIYAYLFDKVYKIYTGNLPLTQNCDGNLIFFFYREDTFVHSMLQ